MVAKAMFKVEKLDATNNFSTWQRKVMVVLF